MISDLADLHEAIQGGDSDEILIAGLQVLGAAFGAKLQGPRSFGKFGAVAGQDHHIATDKSIKTGWTKLFKSVFDRSNMSMQDKANIVENLVGHAGRHSPKYHRFVWEKIKKVKNGKELQKALGEIREAILENPNILKGDGLP